MVDSLRRAGFEVEFACHAAAILGSDFPDVIQGLESALLSVKLPISEIIGSGGGEAQLTQRLRKGFYTLGWRKKNVEIKRVVDGVTKDSITHEIDHFYSSLLGNFALEIEWNNKDPFFDRDLENFKRLHAEGVIGVGAIVTRGSKLQDELKGMIRTWAVTRGLSDFSDLKALGLKRPTERQEALVKTQLSRQASFPEAWSSMFFNDKYGMATTHWSKLQARIRRGVGNPCPLVLVGLPPSIVDMTA
jgi:hypothetical protein